MKNGVPAAWARSMIPSVRANKSSSIVSMRLRVSGPVSVAEISGSESVVHFDLRGLGWVSQSHGVHRFAVGEVADFRLDVARGLYFDAGGRCVSAGGHVMAPR